MRETMTRVTLCSGKQREDLHISTSYCVRCRRGLQGLQNYRIAPLPYSLRWRHLPGAFTQTDRSLMLSLKKKEIIFFLFQSDNDPFLSFNTNTPFDSEKKTKNNLTIHDDSEPIASNFCRVNFLGEHVLKTCLLLHIRCVPLGTGPGTQRYRIKTRAIPVQYLESWILTYDPCFGC